MIKERRYTLETSPNLPPHQSPRSTIQGRNGIETPRKGYHQIRTVRICLQPAPTTTSLETSSGIFITASGIASQISEEPRKMAHHEFSEDPTTSMAAGEDVAVVVVSAKSFEKNKQLQFTSYFVLELTRDRFLRILLFKATTSSSQWSHESQKGRESRQTCRSWIDPEARRHLGRRGVGRWLVEITSS